MSAYEFSRTPIEVAPVDTEHRTIATAIPGPSTAKWLERLEKVEARCMHGQLPIIWDSAFDHYVCDLDGNQFIDFTSGIFVANCGHSNFDVEQAIQERLAASLFHSYAYPTVIRTRYLEKLAAWSGFDKAFLVSSGTEATEHALRLMRAYGSKKRKQPRQAVICIDGGYHGRTLGAAMMSSRKGVGWNYFNADIFHLPFVAKDCLGSGKEWFEQEIVTLAGLNGLNLTTDICGFMIETYQGYSAQFYHPGYVKAIEEFCAENDILLCFDEMQAGFGRTGKKFGFEHYGVQPDLICVGKAMGNGVPLSGVLGRSKVMDIPEVGSIISTHSANPLSCAAGLAVLEQIEELDLVAEAERKGELLMRYLHAMKAEVKAVQWVSGAGLIAAVAFETSERASWVVEKCMQAGLLCVNTGRETVKIGPPLTIPDDALIEGLKVLGKVAAEIP